MTGFVGALVAGLLLAPAAPASQIDILPGSAVRGAEVFESTGCVQCHAVAGRGGTRAPDLAALPEGASSPEGLAAALWNHAPRMWTDIAESGVTVSDLSSAEAADLFSYFYSRLYFSLPGDAERGRRAFADNRCSACHAIGTDAPDLAGPAVSSWNRVRDPIAWAERMWNHAPGMAAEMERSGLRWPELSEQEMSDLLVYFWSLPGTRSQEASFQPGEPELGQALFESRCAGCHSFGQSFPGRVDLLEGPGAQTVLGYAARMWNHAPLMQQGPGTPPALEDGQMEHLVAYLFTQRYFFESGDAVEGGRVYQTRQCVLCHEQERSATGAPDLTQASERYSPITLTRAVWNHGPAMLRSMEARGLDWPVFDAAAMADLIAYLNSRVVPILAR